MPHNAVKQAVQSGLGLRVKTDARFGAFGDFQQLAESIEHHLKLLVVVFLHGFDFPF